MAHDSSLYREPGLLARREEPRMDNCRPALAVCLVVGLYPIASRAADVPYFVTYSHRLEEPGNVEIAINEVAGAPKGGHAFLNTLVEIEYGVKGWWTTELYLSGQGTRHEGSVFTGYR